MNINEVIAQLRIERDRLNAAIEALERLLAPTPEDGEVPKRRGRKTMDTKAREEVSERMKRYWRNRRNSPKAEAQVIYSSCFLEEAS